MMLKEHEMPQGFAAMLVDRDLAFYRPDLTKTEKQAIIALAESWPADAFPAFLTPDEIVHHGTT